MNWRKFLLVLAGLAFVSAAVAAEMNAAPRVVLNLPASKAKPRIGDGDFLRLNDGRILYVYDEFLGASGDNDAAHIVGRASADEGETWTESFEVVPTEGTMNVGGPSLLRLDANRIAIFYLRKNSKSDCTVRMRISTDEGATWTTESISCMADAPVDYYVCNNARARRLKSGRIVLPIMRHHDCDLTTNWFSCLYSDDNAVTWVHSGEYVMYDEIGKKVTTQEPGVEELTDGRLYAYVRTDRGQFWQGYSSDGGATWGDFGPAPFYGPLAPATITRLKDGKLLLVWNDHEGHPELSKAGRWKIGVRTPLTVAVSTDEGKTWTKRRTIEDNTVNAHYCYFSVLEVEGGLLLGYYTTYVYSTGLMSSCVKKIPYEFLDVDGDDYADDRLSVDNTVPKCTAFGSRYVYVFTDKSAVATVTMKKDMVLEEFLVVGGGGGGGGGGATFGSGGGGGGVIHSNDAQRVAANDILTVTVGAGGAGARSSATSSGTMGGHSTLAIGDSTVTAYGGGGGGGGSYPPTASETGEIGSGGGGSATADKWNQGHCGGLSGLIGGGGGGAGTAGDWDQGGEGLAFSLTGANVVYGSGGGGGRRTTVSIGGQGGTNAGNGGNFSAGGAGVDGTGSGGGGSAFKKNSTKYGGGNGGSGAVVLAFTERAAGASRFAVADIPDQLLADTAAVEPSVTVTDESGNVLKLGRDYDVSYADSDAVGTGVAIVSGVAGTTYEGFTAIRPFVIRAVAYEDENVRSSDAGVCRTNIDKRIVYAFTNVAAQIVVRAKKDLSLREYLLVGGGGSGGGLGGGGGGGGGYVSAATKRRFEKNAQFNLQVGAGGIAHPAAAKGPHGCAGGHSWLDSGEGAVYAYGGGGGGGATDALPTAAAATNEIGSAGGINAKSGYVEGAHWNPLQGHVGGSWYSSTVGAGCGGGAGLAGKDGKGGEGITNSITGVAVVYGSGGGRGIKKTGYASSVGTGGTNAGDGGAYAADTTQTPGRAAVAGFGGGGGGGGYYYKTKSTTEYNYNGGGNGGSGTVILSFAPSRGLLLLMK